MLRTAPYAVRRRRRSTGSTATGASAYAEAADRDGARGGCARRARRQGGATASGLFAHNGNDYALAMFGAWRLGADFARHRERPVRRLDLDYYLNDCHAEASSIYTGDHLPTIAAPPRAAPKSVEHYVCLDGAQDERARLARAAGGGARGAARSA